MRTIAIDALGISQPGGGRSATLNVLEQLLSIDTDSRYIVYLDKPEPSLDLGPHVEQKIAPVDQRIAVRLWAETVWPAQFRRDQVDLVHHIKNLAILCPGTRAIITVYDLTTLLHARMFTMVDRLYWRRLMPYYLRRADAVIAISGTTAADIERYYGVSSEKLHVIYPAYSPRFSPQPEDACERVRVRYGTGQRFLLHVGTISRKKNLTVLLKAFEMVRATQPDLSLVLVGRSYDRAQDEAFFKYLERCPHRDAVVLTGPVPDQDMPALYAAATVMVFPSLHEGFGIVPLEAMACGTPVITSAGGALPEVAGGGGIIIQNVDQPQDLARALERMVSDSAWRVAQTQRGLVWSHRYSAREAALQTLALYDEVLGNCGSQDNPQ